MKNFNDKVLYIPEKNIKIILSSLLFIDFVIKLAIDDSYKGTDHLTSLFINEEAADYSLTLNQEKIQFAGSAYSHCRYWQ